MKSGHRKRRRAIDEPGHAHFLTYSCYRRYPLLATDRSRAWACEAIEATRQRMELDLRAYVIMPDHVHLLILPRRADFKMSAILASLKRSVSKLAKAHLVETGDTRWLDRLTIDTQRGPRFRFWQAGGGFDRNVFADRTVPEVVDYIHANPVRRGLVDRSIDWAWSSSRYYETGEAGPVPIDPVEL